MFDAIVERFAQKAPVATLFRATFARVYSAEKLDQIFREHKRRQVEGELLFSTVVELLAPVIYKAQPSLNASYQEHKDHVGVSKAAVYDKLQGVEPQVSAALVQGSVEELAALQRQAQVLAQGPLPGYHVFVIDGKRIDGTEHRLAETRVLKSSPLPGTVLALYDTQLELFVGSACDADAYACERKAVEPLLEGLQPGCVYLADRNFCDGLLIGQFVAAEAYYLLRQHGRSPRWRALKEEPRRAAGQDSKGGQVYEQTIEVYLPDQKRWARSRRITIELTEPTRDGERVLHLLTNLPESVSAVAVADAYRGRWTIETSLGYIAQALNAEINTLAYPGAALLSFCLGLVLFNLVRTIEKLLQHYSQAAPAQATPSKSAASQPDLSHYYLVNEVARVCPGMSLVIDASHWDRYAQMPLQEYLAFVESVARKADLRKYAKSVRGPKRPAAKRQGESTCEHPPNPRRQAMLA